MLDHTDTWMIHSQKHLSCSEKLQDLCNWNRFAWWESFLLCINFDAAWACCDLVISHLLVFRLMSLLLIVFFNHVSLLAVQLFFWFRNLILSVFHSLCLFFVSDEIFADIVIALNQRYYFFRRYAIKGEAESCISTMSFKLHFWDDWWMHARGSHRWSEFTSLW